MKKNIIVAGLPRAGKSTLCQRVMREIGYAHVAMDAVIAGFEKVFPALGIDSSTGPLSFISGKIAPFLQAMMEDEDYDQSAHGMVFDICQLLPVDYARHIDASLCDIYYLGTADVSAGERLAILRERDTPQDYSYFWPEGEKHAACARVVRESRVIREQCAKYDLPYFDTARHREAVLEEIISHIKNS